MSESETAPRSRKQAARQKKQLRKERKAKGNGRDGGIRTPGLRYLLFKDLRPSELPANFRQDLRQLYRFYLDEERRAQLEAMGRVRRTFKLVGWTLKSLLAKLTPGRRLALFASIIMCMLGQVRIPLGDATLSANLRVWAYVFVFLVLMLEMKDKLLARDEIEIARQVQLALLPARHPQPEGWSLWSFMRPANDVGADLVDYIDLPEEHLGVVLGDVAGKGLGAALLTAKLQATLRALVPGCPSLSDLGGQMNEILHKDGIDNRFVTLFYVELQAGSGRLRYLNAGHNPPFVLREKATEGLQASAIPLGMMAGTTYTEGELTLEPGNLLVVYSDGLTEARNSKDEEFGADRLEAMLPRLRGLTAEECVRIIIDEVNVFLGRERPHDDLSLVVLARAGGLRGTVPPPRVTPPPLPM
jgi:sigma-B regulation protein RsbU (phosphoserine phosphatase)